MTLDQLFRFMAEKNASDLYLAAGSPVTVKVNGVCVPLGSERIGSDQVRALLSQHVTAEQFQELDSSTELNIALSIVGIGSFRLSAFKQRGSTSAVIRYIPYEVPALGTLSLPPVFEQLALERRGMVLVVGAAGSGKSTSIASMLDYRNEQLTGHILTLEDPIEFLFRNKKAIVNQREIGSDAKSFHSALRNAMRQAPDVIFLGEIRDREMMAAAISYAMSGHLVVSTLHATNSAHALNRVISFYPPETRQALFQDLSVALRAVMAMRLVRSVKGKRVPSVEVLLNAGHITNLIERGDVPAIKEALERSLSPGSQSFEQSLYALLQSGQITREVALEAADSKNNLLWLINNAGQPQEGSPAPAAQEETPRRASFAEFTLNI